MGRTAPRSRMFDGDTSTISGRGCIAGRVATIRDRLIAAVPHRRTV